MGRHRVYRDIGIMPGRRRTTESKRNPLYDREFLFVIVVQDGFLM